MSQSVVESLMAMGFEQAVAEQAFQATGRSSLELALDWIMQNPGGDSGAAAATDADGTVADGGIDGDGAEPAVNGGDGDGDGGEADPDDDGLTAAEGVPNALKCDECGKLLKDAMSAEIHAGRTQHVSFSETTEAIQPLTDEEKAAKVEEIKQRIAERRREREAQEAAERIEREKRRREGGKQSAAMKEELRRKEVERQAIMRRKEKEDDIKARQAIRDKLKAQKEARKAAREAKRNGGTAPAATATAATATAATADPVPMDASPTKVEPAKVYDTARIQVRLTDGSSITNTFEATATISDVYTWVNQERTDGHGMFVLMTSFPRKVYEGSEMATTLAEADLVPSGVLIASAR